MPVNEIDETVALVTLEETRLYVLRNASDRSRDEQLIDAINDVSASVVEYCEREFLKTTGDTVTTADPGTGDTTLAVTSADGFPDSGSFYVQVDDEVMLVTAGAGTTSWTVTRAQLDTTAAAHAIGAAVIELEARDFRYRGTGTLDLSPYDLRDAYRITLYTDLETSLQETLEASSYRLTPVGGFPGSATYLGLGLPYPAVEEAAFGFGWQVTVLGRWGMTTVPYGVKLGTKIWIDNIVKNPGAYASNAMNGYTVFPDVDEEGRRAGMPPATRYRLDRWARNPGGSGHQTHGVVTFTNAGDSGAPAIPNTLPLP